MTVNTINASIFPGQDVGITMTILDPDTGLNVAPAALTLEILSPANVLTTKTLSDMTTLSTGVYYYVYSQSLAGKYIVYCKTTSPNTAQRSYFTVESKGY